MPNQDWSSVDVVSEHIRRAADDIARFEAASFESFMSGQLSPNEQPEQFQLKLESPLEAIFYIWWEAMVGRGYWSTILRLDMQEPVQTDDGDYRLDFAVSLCGGSEFSSRYPKIAVEVDGHAFHERTQEQAALRNQRDRALQRATWTVFHFSWSEMTARPAECIGEVLGFAKQAYWNVQRQVKAAEREAANKVDALIGN